MAETTNQRPSFLIEDLLECHRRLQEKKRQEALNQEAEIQRNLQRSYELHHDPSLYFRQNLTRFQPPYMFQPPTHPPSSHPLQNHPPPTLSSAFRNYPSFSLLNQTDGSAPPDIRFPVANVVQRPFSQHYPGFDTKCKYHIPLKINHHIIQNQIYLSNYFSCKNQHKSGKLWKKNSTNSLEIPLKKNSLNGGHHL